MPHTHDATEMGTYVKYGFDALHELPIAFHGMNWIKINSNWTEISITVSLNSFRLEQRNFFFV